MCKCSLCSSYFILLDSLNMSSFNMVNRRNANVKSVVEKCAANRLYSGHVLSKKKVPPKPQDSRNPVEKNPWTKRSEGKKVEEAVVVEKVSEVEYSAGEE